MATALIENFMTIQVLVEMTLGTDWCRWWADLEFGSKLWILRQTGKTAPELETDVRQEIERALAWIKQDGLAKEISCTTEVVGKNRINYLVVVKKSSGGTEFIEGVWNGLQAA
jgi:Mu-like prophage protein gp46